ncbi:MAG: indole-3-glycerol phosphate synthase TrpC [Balneolaceae bacterium]|nr:indole-3-glycerol phosphate synthase TrpC [Balneolaceae bacterium]
MSILDQIVESKRLEIRKHQSHATMQDFDGFDYFHQPTHSLKEALQREGKEQATMPAIIAEFKRGSPSKGVFAPEAEPISQAKAYAKGGAAACSILTDSPFFKGSLTDLQTVRREVELPLLRKDFIIDPYQVFEAKAYGADAILLIERILSPAQTQELVDAAAECDLDVLLEIDAAEVWSTVEGYQESVAAVGMNSRNLATFDTDADHGLSELQGIPSSVIRVMESGIQGPEPLVACATHHIDAALIGEALMRSSDPASLLQQWQHEVKSQLT